MNILLDRGIANTHEKYPQERFKIMHGLKANNFSRRLRNSSLCCSRYSRLCHRVIYNCGNMVEMAEKEAETRWQVSKRLIEKCGPQVEMTDVFLYPCKSAPEINAECSWNGINSSGNSMLAYMKTRMHMGDMPLPILSLWKCNFLNFGGKISQNSGGKKRHIYNM